MSSCAYSLLHLYQTWKSSFPNGRGERDFSALLMEEKVRQLIIDKNMNLFSGR